MSAAIGGVPYVIRETVDTTGHKIVLPFFTSYMIVRNRGANAGKLFFSLDDYTNGVRFIDLPVPAAATPYGEWQGPVKTAHDKYSDIYAAGVGGDTTLEIVVFQRDS